MRGINMLIQDRQAKRLPERSTDMIILLTDGSPNSGKHADCFHTKRRKTVASYFHVSFCVSAGVSHIPTIQENVHSAIGGNISLYCLGFGNDVEYSFLDVLSKQNQGVARRIFEASDASLQLQVTDVHM